jgi:5-methylcytosine-specific restriction endonuclease McrA
MSHLLPGGSTREWRRIRLQVLKRDGRVCAYCALPAATVDHIVPRANGGKDEPRNMVACCARCNGRKGSKSMQKWYSAVGPHESSEG